MFDIQELERRHAVMRDSKALEEPAFRDIARILRPDDQSFARGEKIDRDAYDLFDSTPLYANAEFASGMFTEAVNPAERWMELTIEDKDLAKWGPVQAWLWGEASLVFNSLSPAVSGFYGAAHGWFANGGAFGNAFEYQEEWVGKQKIIDLNIPIGQSFFDVDIAGDMCSFDREWRVKGWQAQEFFGDAARGLNADREYTLVHAVYQNPDYKPGMIGQRGKLMASTYYTPDDRDFRVDRGYFEMPYAPLFWDKRNGRAWASGPGHNARADMNMNNEIARSNMVDAQFSAEPLILTSKEGLFSAADIMPNNILEGALNPEGKKQVEYLQRGDNSARAESKAQQVRDAIKEAWHFNLDQVAGRPQMTATEFMGWKAERLRQLAPHLVRVQQGLAAFVGRRYRILARAGQTMPPPPELAGHNVAVEFVSPLAKAQRLATGQAVMQWVGMLGEVAKAKGDPSVLDNINEDGVARVLHEAIVGEPAVLNDQNTVAGKRQQRAQFEQQQIQAENASKAAGMVADVAHASQAMTLSQKRAGAPAQ